ncbi:GNAT family N-acetyltransferase [Novosphingobium sp. CF614]|uniref:GNAT family N-acetyltransferase n=1 Tax=Novosphingobium sp. CF614 TaxID=1884364 RepID=UPI000B8538D6|nr:GNAT family N-acetyltransferase [Novosphingobium sp. CF614]
MDSAIELSDDPARIDLGRVHGWLASSYWTPGIAREAVERQNAGSHCLGAYRSGHGQVGFARMISDRASFAWLADVWVDESVRGQGIGRQMVRWFVEHPDYATVRRFALTTADAHGVYAALGFTPLLRPERVMERLSPEFAAMLRVAP